MAVKIQLIQAADFEMLAQIDDLAMADNGPSQVLAQYVPPEVGRSRLFAGWIETLWNINRDTCWKVVDTRTQEIRSFAIFTFEQKPHTPIKVRGHGPADSEPSEIEKVMSAVWSKWNDFRKRENVDAITHGELRVIETHPAHMGKGYAAMLLDKGDAFADNLGLPLFLYSTIEAKDLYQRAGYLDMGADSMDLAPYGIQTVCTRHCMKRSVQAS